MFGYIKPMTSELRVREHELYKSIYCGLCGAMGEHICSSDRLTLSYDIVFLALVRASVTGEQIHIEKKRCLAHPLKRRNRAYIPETLKYCARVSAVLTYYNVKDDVEDNGKLKSRLLLPGAKRFMKKAKMPDIAELVAEDLGKLSALEKKGGSLDLNAECFGELLGKIFAYGLGSIELYNMGFHIGKWIYMTDAADDLEKDRASGEYNPLSSYEELPREALNLALTLELEAAYAAYSRTETKNQVLRSIIENILTLGMPDVIHRVTGENK